MESPELLRIIHALHATVGMKPDDAGSGEWDFAIRIPSDSKKNELRALNFNACGSRTHWVYRWCSIFEKDE